MKVIIPAAGAGTRLKPHTHTKPKPMVYVAGKPIIGHILDRVSEIDPDELIVVVGYRKDVLCDYIIRNFSHKLRKITFVEQDVQRGLAHAIYLCRDAVDGDSILISLGDMLFKTDYKGFMKLHQELMPCDGSIGIKKVDDPENYGIVIPRKGDKTGIDHMVEKPEKPESNLAIAGVYIIENSELLFSSIEKLMKKSKSNGELQLTDALQIMLDSGADLKIFDVYDWYDCGRPETLLQVNKMLLNELAAGKTLTMGHIYTENSVIIPPAVFDGNVVIKNSIVGPHVSVAADTVIENSIICSSIIGTSSYIRDMNLSDSIIGEEVRLVGKKNSVNIGDNSTIDF